MVLACLAAEAAVDLARPGNFAGKSVIDATDALSEAPPVDGVLGFFTGPNGSLGERIRARLPVAHVVKAFPSVGGAHVVDAGLEQGTPRSSSAAKTRGPRPRSPGSSGPWAGSPATAAASARRCLPGRLRNEWHHAFELRTR
jgi:hypothetical protein